MATGFDDTTKACFLKKLEEVKRHSAAALAEFAELTDEEREVYQLSCDDKLAHHSLEKALRCGNEHDVAEAICLYSKYSYAVNSIAVMR